MQLSYTHPLVILYTSSLAAFSLTRKNPWFSHSFYLIIPWLECVAWQISRAGRPGRMFMFSSFNRGTPRLLAASSSAPNLFDKVGPEGIGYGVTSVHSLHPVFYYLGVKI
ncbi:hypothetical protein F4778DRAFT_745967 [Xylariomycetidae sp. FL2044]|nr:hypothetical protein F4778DRAFT_745967 [Xylariomycetidae sp. FL2044]